MRIVNGSPYGLLSAVFTRDLRRGASGVGRVGGRFSMDRLTELNIVVVNLA